MGISTHVLDTSAGRPAIGVPVTLERRSDAGSWRPVAEATTDDDGRAADLIDATEVSAGLYRLVFDVAGYAEMEDRPFFPSITLTFRVADPAEHYHVPLLLSPFGYTTYRGS